MPRFPKSETITTNWSYFTVNTIFHFKFYTVISQINFLHQLRITTSWDQKFDSQIQIKLNKHILTKNNVVRCRAIMYIKQHHPETIFTTMTMVLATIRGILMYWTAYIRPISCPLREFLLTPENSWKLHPLGTRKRSSFNIASALARRRQPSSSVQKPIPALGTLTNHSQQTLIYIQIEVVF